MPLDPMPAWVLPRRRAIGEHLRTARVDAGLTQLQLGQRVGRDHKTIHRWERGDSDPRLSDLILLAHALDLTLAELLGD